MKGRTVEKAVVSAAGRGERLWPLTANRPKHMIPLAGRPILEHLVLAVKAAGIHNFVLVVGTQGEQIRHHFDDGSRWRVRIEYVTQSEASGTAGAVAAAQGAVEDKPFLAVYGDLVIRPAALRTVLKAYGKNGVATVGLVPVQHPENYGIAKTIGKRLAGIVEKPFPAAGLGNLANAGVYVFNPSIFDHILRVERSPRGEFEITDALTMAAKSRESVAWAGINPEDWQDIGRPWDIVSANASLLAQTRRLIRGKVEAGAVINAPVIVQAGATVRTGTVIDGPAWIGEGATVGPFAHLRDAVAIGNGAQVGNFCEVKNSVIMDRTHIAHLSYVGDSVIGEDCNLGAGTKIANLKFSGRTVRVKIKNALEDSGRLKLGVIMGDGVKTGVNSSIMPGTRIAPGTIIPAGTVIAEDQPTTIG